MIHLLSAKSRESRELYAPMMTNDVANRKMSPTRRKRKGSVAKRLLSSERATLSESGLSSSWLAENGRASCADDNGLCVREDSGDGEATWALDVHEERSWSWDKGLYREVSASSFSHSLLRLGVIQFVP